MGFFGPLRVNLWVGVHPFAGVVVRHGVVVAIDESRHRIDANDAIVRFGVRIDIHAEIYANRPALLGCRGSTILIDKGFVERGQDFIGVFVEIVPLVAAKCEENVAVLKRFRLVRRL